MLPTESQEQIAFVRYLRLMNIPHFRVPNETYTKSYKQKSMNKMLGVSSGVPDLFVIVAGRMIAIEMKRKKQSNVTANQKYWLKLLNESGVKSHVCYGCEQAVEVINKYLEKSS
jgi:sulfur relay (sulfurtransferase) complex TusBCD TusD component (DsrE family)